MTAPAIDPQRLANIIKRLEPSLFETIKKMGPLQWPMVFLHQDAFVSAPGAEFQVHVTAIMKKEFLETITGPFQNPEVDRVMTALNGQLIAAQQGNSIPLILCLHDDAERSTAYIIYPYPNPAPPVGPLAQA